MKIYQVDAFTSHVFGGNPAAVIPLEEWLPDETLQNIAMENNLSETAYFVPIENGYHLRWFTPIMEIELCGHATLASAWVLFNELGHGEAEIRFNTMSGPLTVQRDGHLLAMNFPAAKMKRIEYHPEISAGLSAEPDELYESNTKFMAVFGSASLIHNMKPDFACLSKAGKNLIITAKGDDCDFISRFFAPVSGIDEDPVTGSAHTALAPYWADRLGKDQLTARQVSKRGGELWVELSEDRVIIKGKACLYMIGQLVY